MSHMEEKETPPTAYANDDGGISDSISFLSLDQTTNFHRQISRNSKKKNSGVSAQEQARIISNATNMATAAAKSILLSGGTVDTALRTAQAAAESLLLPTAGNSNASKRQAKQQAQVVASMALVTAQTATAQGGVFSQDASAIGPGGAVRQPPLVIHQSSGTRREELSSVGFGSLAEESMVKKIFMSNRTNPPPSWNDVYQSPTSAAVKRPPQLPTPKYLPTPKNESSASNNNNVIRFNAVEVKKKSVDGLTREKSNEDNSNESLKNFSSYNKSKSNETNDHHHPSSYTDDEHSISVSLSDEGRSISMDSLDDDEYKPRNSLLSFGQMLADGMFCGPTDCSYDRRRDDADDHSMGQRSPSCPADQEESKKEKTISKKLPSRKPMGCKKSPPKSNKEITIKTNSSENSGGSSSSKSRKSKKKEIKDSMEKVVLRALATGETTSAHMDQQVSIDGSAKSTFTYSSKRSKSSKAQRITSWMRDRVQKKKLISF